MERRIFSGYNLYALIKEASEWLECDIRFISSSYAKGDFGRTRYFEKYQQRHATIQYQRGVKY